MVQKYPKHPGRIDLFALVLAIEEKTTLLTGDNALRKAALQEGVDVHGIIWLLDKMIQDKVISKAEGCRSLKLMTAGNQRLPHNDVMRRLADWCH
jgi:predicted nucleic acid-binding protein